jgi:hypothetical protein
MGVRARAMTSFRGFESLCEDTKKRLTIIRPRMVRYASVHLDKQPIGPLFVYHIGLSDSNLLSTYTYIANT